MLSLPPIEKRIPTLMHGEGDEAEVLEIGSTLIVKKMEEIPSDLMADLKAIFFSSLEGHDTECQRYIDCGKLDRYEKVLQLPRRLPEKHDFSGNILVVFKTLIHSDWMVFVVDWCEHTKKINLFHVVTKARDDDVEFGCLPKVKTTGYATIGHKLYIVGGAFFDHDVGHLEYNFYKNLQSDLLSPEMVEEVEKMVETKARKHLCVPTYNFKTGEWESDTPHLSGPKPYPVVFVYDGNIYALAGHPPFQLHDKSPKFEFLDNNDSSWTRLPPPLFHMKHYSHHFLDQANGVFFLFFNRSALSCFDDYYDYHYDYEEEEEGDYRCCQLDLKANSLRWRDVSYKLKPDTGSSVGLELRRLSPEQSGGCIVDNILFYQGMENEEPVIFGNEVYGGSQQWIIRGLDKVFEGKVPPRVVFGSLNHITNLRFCLLIRYPVGSARLTAAMYSLVFDLEKEYEYGDHRRIKDHSMSKAQKAEKFNFLLKPVCDGVFQLPFGLSLEFCKKLDF